MPLAAERQKGTTIHFHGALLTIMENITGRPRLCRKAKWIPGAEVEVEGSSASPIRRIFKYINDMNSSVVVDTQTDSIFNVAARRKPWIFVKLELLYSVLTDSVETPDITAIRNKTSNST
mmetsp:Transcript_20589/g.34473  ORF Transcript_20589/g.34473 Transcript_20589/m.34473 type:complete len:120 (+) Transcript_20589:1121-1480(+)